MEGLTILHRYIFTLHYTVEVVYEMNQFLVVDVRSVGVIERYDRDTIRKLEAKTIDSIINNNDLSEILVFEYT